MPSQSSGDFDFHPGDMQNSLNRLVIDYKTYPIATIAQVLTALADAEHECSMRAESSHEVRRVTSMR